ncbi:MAG: hypothetical protein OEV91_11430, partial [Desulfobulbaceae bacterium]|nr:hypothetical protein [Desulfobulbaceae bacterium]
MKKYLAGLGTGLLMVGTAVTAGATTTTFTDVYTPATSFYTGSTTTYSFLHDITDNGFSPGVIGAPGVDTITSAVLRIYTHDDDSKDSAEKYKFTIDNTYVDSAAIDPASTTPYSYTFTQLD